MIQLPSTLVRWATPRGVLLSFSAMVALLVAENLLAVSPGVVYLRSVTHGLNFLDFGFTPASSAHAALSALGPAGRRAQALLLGSMDLLIPFASGLFGTLAIVAFTHTLVREPKRWRALTLIPLAAMALDYAENMSIAGLLVTFPRDPAWLSVLTFWLTRAKFACYGGSLLLVMVLGAALVIRRRGCGCNFGLSN
jgi:hypothetical protein